MIAVHCCGKFFPKPENSLSLNPKSQKPPRLFMAVWLLAEGQQVRMPKLYGIDYASATKDSKWTAVLKLDFGRLLSVEEVEVGFHLSSEEFGWFGHRGRRALNPKPYVIDVQPRSGHGSMSRNAACPSLLQRPITANPKP